jgi:hypothetical protein
MKGTKVETATDAVAVLIEASGVVIVGMVGCFFTHSRNF